MSFRDVHNEVIAWILVKFVCFRHLCEFTGCDFEMAIKEHYYEVLQVILNEYL